MCVAEGSPSYTVSYSQVNLSSHESWQIPASASESIILILLLLVTLGSQRRRCFIPLYTSLSAVLWMFLDVLNGAYDVMGLEKKLVGLTLNKLVCSSQCEWMVSG